MEPWVFYLIDGLIALVFFFAFITWMRTRYQRAIKGHLVSEFWTQAGTKYIKLIPIEPNGFEIKGPQEHDCPRYFFEKKSIYTTNYPAAPMFNLSMLQVAAPSVAWPENCPEPINPYSHELVTSSSFLAHLRDEEFMAFAMAASKEIEELQKKLAIALSRQMNPVILYTLLTVAIVGAVMAAYMSYQSKGILDAIRQGFGL